MSIFQRILVPVDDSEAARVGLDTAVKLVREQQASLKLITVVNEAPSGFNGSELGWINRNGMEDLLRHNAQQIIDEALKRAADSGIQADSELIEAPDGHIVQHIVDAVEAWKADLVVIGTQGRHGLDRWLLGSTTETMLSELRVPMLVIPPQGHQ